MTLSRRNFLLGSAAAVVAASPVVRAIAAQPVYTGEIGKWSGITIRDVQAMRDLAATRGIPAYWMGGEGFYFLPVHPTMARDLRA